MILIGLTETLTSQLAAKSQSLVTQDMLNWVFIRADTTLRAKDRNNSVTRNQYTRVYDNLG